MLVLVIVAPTVIALIALASIVRARRRRHTDAGLSDDWWPKFERAFRDYVRSRSSSAS